MEEEEERHLAITTKNTSANRASRRASGRTEPAPYQQLPAAIVHEDLMDTQKKKNKLL